MKELKLLLIKLWAADLIRFSRWVFSAKPRSPMAFVLLPVRLGDGGFVGAEPVNPCWRYNK